MFHYDTQPRVAHAKPAWPHSFRYRIQALCRTTLLPTGIGAARRRHARKRVDRVAVGASLGDSQNFTLEVRRLPRGNDDGNDSKPAMEFDRDGAAT